MNSIIYRISTIKFIFRNLNTYKNSAVKKTRKLFESSFVMDHQMIKFNVENQVFKEHDFLRRMTYKNEEWEVVKFRFHDRFLKYFRLPTNTKDNHCVDGKTKIVKNNLYFKSLGLKDDWIYFYLKDLTLKDYILNFEAVFHSKFREIQFGFRYLDFYNRYRFRIEDNLLHFDIVRKGQFYNSLVTYPFHFNCDEIYNINIIVKNDKYSFVCNGKVIMTVSDNLGLFRKGAVALILWDDSGESNIQGSFKNIKFNHII